MEMELFDRLFSQKEDLRLVDRINFVLTRNVYLFSFYHRKKIREKKKKESELRNQNLFLKSFGLMLIFIFTVKLILKDTPKVKKILNKSI